MLSYLASLFRKSHVLSLHTNLEVMVVYSLHSAIFITLMFLIRTDYMVLLNTRAPKTDVSVDSFTFKLIYSLWNGTLQPMQVWTCHC